MSGINVLRYSALGAGVFYGFSHQRAINSAGREATKQHELKHKEDLISKAKQEWTNKNSPKQSGTDSVISDPSDPLFDLEAYLTKAAESK